MIDPADSSTSAGTRSAIGITVDRSRCILCGEPNECALASGDAKSDETCWCVGESFPAILLATAASRDDGESCICRACLERTKSDAEEA